MKSVLLRVRRRFWLPVFAAAFLVGGSAMSLRFASADPAPRESESASHATRWVATWGAGAQNIGFVFGGITIRNIIFTSVGGSEVRVPFTNAFGDQPLAIGQAAIGLAGAGSSIDGPNAAVTFFGRRSVTIPPGAEVLSDPVRLDVPALSDLAITEYLPQGDNQNGSGHSDAQQTSYFTFGNYTSDTSGTPINVPVGSWYYIDGVDVLPNRPVEGTMVAIGDSITDGFRSTVDANRRWPNDLARRLEARAGLSLGVTDAGISGNELLQDRSPGGANQNAVARFERDVLDRAGVRDVILLEGVNDIEVADATAAEIIAGYEQIISQAHEKGLRIFGGTITPCGCSGSSEATREAVNQWILSSGAFDGAIDFAKALEDPGDPTRLDPAYDSGDHLHPNDAGYQAMSDAVGLSKIVHHDQ